VGCGLLRGVEDQRIEVAGASALAVPPLIALHFQLVAFLRAMGIEREKGNWNEFQFPRNLLSSP
jgi:hypothetical protein